MLEGNQGLRHLHQLQLWAQLMANTGQNLIVPDPTSVQERDPVFREFFPELLQQGDQLFTRHIILLHKVLESRRFNVR